MRAAFSRKVRKLVFAASTATRARLVGSHLSPLVSPHIEGKQCAPEAVVRPDQ
jgi:hypothetical protein